MEVYFSAKNASASLELKHYREVNLGILQSAIDAKKIDASKPIDIAALKSAGLIKTPKDGVRLLAKGELNTKITIEVAGASKAAVAAVEKAGGSVIVAAPAKAPSKDSTAQA